MSGTAKGLVTALENFRRRQERIAAAEHEQLGDAQPQPREGLVYHRDLWCRRVERCVAHAAILDWPSLDCSACPIAGTEQVGTGGERVPRLYRIERPHSIARPRGTLRERLLVVLREAGPLTPTQLADRALETDVSVLVRTLGALVDLGFVRRLDGGKYEVAA